MDKATVDYYEAQAASIAARYESASSPIERLVAVAFPSGSAVLDIGAGSGRDLAMLSRLGYDAYGVEPSSALRTLAGRLHPELEGRIQAGSLPDLKDPQGRVFDGILCSAVLMHLPEADLFDAAFALRRLLKTHGRLLISLPQQRSDVLADERDAAGRLFKSYTAEYMSLLLERVGFQQIGRWVNEDALGRDKTSWYTLLFELRSGSALRAVDQIEGILNRDRKVATYKLALFRALAQIATQEPHTAVWRSDGIVGIPIDAIAERWLLYYWPLFASQRHIPQSQSEGKGEQKPVAFRAALLTLIDEFRMQGEHAGLTSWQLARTAGRLSPQANVALMIALRKIKEAIRYGPVFHSGGALETGRVFGYDPKTQRVEMAAEIWRELSLLGHWIIDAVIVRWAALTEQFSRRQGIHSGDVLPLLLASPVPERAAGLAREIYISRGVERCVWSDRRLGTRFAVDHVIAFTLWGNNDLWNLLPVDERINNQKSDKLPSAELLRQREFAVIEGWRVLRDALPEAFDRQAGRLLGRPLRGPQHWEQDLFARLREAVELTALHRGVERWAPKGNVAHAISAP